MWLFLFSMAVPWLLRWHCFDFVTFQVFKVTFLDWTLYGSLPEDARKTKAWNLRRHIACVVLSTQMIGLIDIDSVSQHDSESESSDCLGAMVSKEKLELSFQI